MSLPELNHSLRIPILAWLSLVGLTLFSWWAGQGLVLGGSLPWLVAGIIWVKGWVVTRCFIESRLAHPFIARVLACFIAGVPVVLVLTVLLGQPLVNWLHH